jgi:hypothetical protein
MKKREEETKKQAVPVMKQLARPISAEELATVSGAVSRQCSGDFPGDVDYLQ